MARPPRLRLRRRELLAMSSALLWAPRPGRAASSTRRKFLFVFCQGGWDQTRLFAPLFDSSGVDMEADAALGMAGDLPYVDHPDRPSVRAWMDSYGDKTCFLNGFEARSVAHDVCLRLVMTGTSLPAADDWPALIGAGSGAELLLPVIHLSGPSYAYAHGSVVVRVGASGQLPELIDGTALDRADLPQPPPDLQVEALEEALLDLQIQRRLAAAQRGRARQLLEEVSSVEERMGRVSEVAQTLAFGEANTLSTKMALLAQAFSQGVAVAGMVKDGGWLELGYDSHADIDQQSRSMEQLFGATLETMALMEALPGEFAPTLAEETTIVLMSEMGRYPQLNARGGKEHWTFTSAILIGSGVRGGQAIGGYDIQCAGQKVDLASGAVTDSGNSLVPDNVGATLLALAGIDPAEQITGAEPILAALD